MNARAPIMPEEWNRVLAITLTAPFLFGKYVANEMIARGKGGRIVNVSSTSGYYGRDKATAYTAAKGGVVTAIARDLKIPIRFVGIGEKMDDLIEFSADDFVESLFAA